MNIFSEYPRFKLYLIALLILIVNIIGIQSSHSYISAHINVFDGRTDQIIKEFTEQAAAQHMNKGQVALIQHTLGNIKIGTGSLAGSVASVIIGYVSLMIMVTIFLIIAMLPRLNKAPYSNS